MKRILITKILIIAMIIPALSQNSVDALRYSKITFGGTARYMGMCGAFGALGADFSALSTNPAGIGLYKKSEYTITPSIYIGRTSSTYNGQTGEDNKINFNLGNAGIILTQDISQSKKAGSWKNVQFGFGLNRNNNFNNRIYIEGVNSKNSLVDTYAEYANGIYYRDIEEDKYNDYTYDLNLAWWTYLIDTIGSSTTYKSAAPPGDILQRKSIENWGSMNEMVLSFGANYNDILYIGATFGFPTIRYFQRSTYRETALTNATLPNDKFREFTLWDDLETRGTGFNFKFGVIVRAADWVRIGAAIHTPTYYKNLTDEWNTSIKSEFDDGFTEVRSSPYGTFDYDLTTPMRAIGSIAFIIGQYGLISADYEYVNYSDARLRSKSYSFFNENDDINRKYTSTGNIRVGTEWRCDRLRFRGGYAFYGSPFKSGINDGTQNSYSLGLGFREKYYFIDFAWVLTKSSEDYYLYGTSDIVVNPVKNDFTNNNFLLTFGLRF